VAVLLGVAAAVLVLLSANRELGGSASGSGLRPDCVASLFVPTLGIASTLKTSGFRTVELLRLASPAEPVERRIVSNGVLAGLFALLAALGLVFVLERLSRR